MDHLPAGAFFSPYPQATSLRGSFVRSEKGGIMGRSSTPFMGYLTDPFMGYLTDPFMGSSWEV